MAIQVQNTSVIQGFALARRETQEIIAAIRQRAAAGSLNRGLRLRLPYFDDQQMKLEVREFQVIPEGRIPFIPAYVVYSCREEQRKVERDHRLSPATRAHLVSTLQAIIEAFDQPDSARQ